MFALRPRYAGGDERRLSVEQLSLGGDNVRLGGGACVILVLRDRHRTLVVFDGPGEQLLERIGLSQGHIGERQGRLRGKQRVCKKGGVRLRARLFRFDRPPDLAPDVKRPRPGGFRGKIRPPGRKARRRPDAVHRGKEAGARLIDERQGLTIIGLVRLNRLIGHRDDPHKLVQLPVMEDRPPLAFRLVRPRRRDLPTLDLLELRRHDRRRPLEIGADRRTPGSQKRNEKRRGASDRQKFGPASFSRLARVLEGYTGGRPRPSGFCGFYPHRRDAGYVVTAQGDGRVPLRAACRRDLFSASL